jgi:hypothetical protein
VFIRIKQVKSNSCFYLMQSQRVEGKPHPVPKTIAYLGNRNQAISRLEASDYPAKDKLLSQVRAATPTVGKNQGKRGRPKKA